jgi:hypothetical protein
MSETRVIPDIPNIKAHWERRSNPIPFLMVPMSDGTVMRFNAEIQHPGFVKALDGIRKMEVGYKAKK